MRILLINCVCGIRSTGRICADIAREYESKGYVARIAYGRMDDISEESRKWAVKIGNKFSLYLHFLLTRIFDLHGSGLCSYFATKKFLRWADSYDPDVLWLHNFHGYFINYELLFRWIKQRPKMRVKWTLHDCWPFTGHCSHFLYTGCQAWQIGCDCRCPGKGEFPKSMLFSKAAHNWKKKKAAFCGVRNMELITPSKWLADLTRQSFLREYPVSVVHNTVDKSVFRRTDSDFKQKCGIDDKIMVLGVASTWDERKGYRDFLELRGFLSSAYVIVIVGVTPKQRSSLPVGIIGVECTNSAKELASIYSAADWFFNPTREDNYPTVNLEARACGCRVVTYDTGGAAETISGYENGWVLSGEDRTPLAFASLVAGKSC